MLEIVRNHADVGYTRLGVIRIAYYEIMSYRTNYILC